MTVLGALLAFSAAAALLTITPGLDTMLVVRTRLSLGRHAALQAAGGVAAGCLAWGVAVALGLGAVLKAAPIAYEALRWCGAVYLLLAGLRLLARPRTRLDLPAHRREALGKANSAFLTGLFTNLLNPKVGLFYLSFLPQFVPAGVSATPFMLGLTALHVVMGLVWLATLSASLGVVQSFVVKPAALRWLDRATGGVFILFGLKLALDRA